MNPAYDFHAIRFMKKDENFVINKIGWISRIGMGYSISMDNSRFDTFTLTTAVYLPHQDAVMLRLEGKL